MAERQPTNAAIAILFTVILGSILGHAVVVYAAGVDRVNVVLYKVSSHPPAWPYAQPLAVAGCAIAALLLYSAYERCRKDAPQRSCFTVPLALSPAALLLPLLFMEPSFLGALVFVIAVSLTAYRVAVAWPLPVKLPWRPGPTACAVWVVTGFAAATTYFTLLQCRALNTLFLNYSDWAIYLNVIDNTLHGRWFYSNEYGGNYMGHHFMPGAVALLAPIVWCFRSITAFFAMNAAVLHVGAVIVYFFGLRRGVPPWLAAVYSTVFLLHPSLSQMTLSLYYGFHPVYLTIPIVCLWFTCYDAGRIKTAMCLFLLALTIKETVPIFFIGLGLVLISRGDRRHGAWMSAIACVYFVLVTFYIVPGISGETQYHFAKRYAGLGDSTAAIALSPITNPRAFFGALLRPHNLYFPLLICLPALVTLPRNLIWLGAALIPILATGLQDSNQLATIALHYQSEVVALVMVVGMMGLTPDRRDAAGWWDRVARPIRGTAPEATQYRVAAGVGVFTAGLLSHVFFGLGYVGKNYSADLFHSPQFDAAIEQFKGTLPKGTTVTATPRIAAHLVLHNDVYPVLSNPPSQDIAIFDLDDDLAHRETAETYRRRIATSPAYALSSVFDIGGHRFAVYRRQPPPPGGLPEFATLSDEEWARTGEVIATDHVQLEARVTQLPRRRSDGAQNLELTYRVAAEIGADLDLVLEVMTGNPAAPAVERIALHFGDGYLPAYLAVPGDTFRHQVTVAGPVIRNAMRLRVRERPAPDYTQPAF